MIRNLLILILLTFSTMGFAQIASWDPTGLTSYGPNPWSASSNDANVTVTGFVRGSGLGTSGTPATDSYGGSGANQSTQSDAISNGDYFTFTVKANSGYKMSLTGIPTWYTRRSGSSGTCTVDVQYSFDGTNFTDIGSISVTSTSGSGSSTPLTFPQAIKDALADLSSSITVTLRFVVVSSAIRNIYPVIGQGTRFQLDGSVSVDGGCTPPSTYPSSLAVGNETTSSLDVSWANSNSDYIIVLAHKGSAVNADPANGTAYTGNAAFGSGDPVGTGNYVVYIGTGSSVTVTGLDEGTTYYFKAYSFDNVTNCYNTTNTTSGSGTTDVTPPCTPPTTYPTGLTTSNETTTSMDVTWTNSVPDDIIVLAHAGSAVDADPVNGQTYFANAAFSLGSEIGTGNYVVYIGTGTSVNVTNLTANTTYHYAAYSFNSTTKCYNTTNPATGSGMTTNPPAGDYRSKATGAWESASTWEYSTDNGTTWQDAVQAPSSTDGTITILSTHKVTFNANRTVDQLTIASGGELEVVTGTLTIAGGSGTDLVINGMLTYTGGDITLDVSATGEVNNGGTYNYNEDNKVKAPALTWNTGSTLQVSRVGSTTTIHTSMAGQTLYNVVWNTTNQSSTVNFEGQITTINGDFSLIKGGASNKGIRLTSASASSDLVLTIGGNLNISAGQIFEFSNGNKSCTVILNGNLNNSGDLYTNTKGGSTLKGRLEVKGNINSTGIIRSSGTNVDNKIVLNGNTIQEVSIADELKPYTTGSSDILTLEIDNMAGVRLLSDLKFKGSSVAFTNGHIYTEGKTFDMRSGSITNTSEAYFVTASPYGDYYATGGLRQGFPTVTTSRVYPVGPTGALYMPATVTMTAGMVNDSFDVRVVPLGEHGVTPNDAAKCIQYQWEIGHTNATGSANLKLQWAATTEGMSFNPNLGLYIGHWNSGSNKFDVINTATYNMVDPSATSSTAFSNFSPFVVSSDLTALPVQWLDIKAVRRDNRVMIQWNTADERDVRNYEVERRSVDGSFTTIGSVMPHNNTVINTYSLVDERPVSGNNYYRVRQVDANGQYSYSRVVQISFEKGTSFGIRNLGQQAFGFTGIDRMAILKVYDINGRLLLIRSVTNEDREFLTGFNSGSYAITLEEGDNRYSGIFLLNR
ncbi:MAG: hypothetical protein J5I59_02000 [Saprospiraceae bacterium]|nr:hypothetical protein [Saprospiraceae bacterium]